MLSQLDRSDARAAARRYVHPFIAGGPRPAASGRRFETIDPATAEPIAEVDAGGSADVAAAVEAARAASPSWRRVDPGERAAVIDRAAALIDERATELAAVEALDAGKPLADAIGQVHATADAFRYWARVAQELRTAVVPTRPRSLNYGVREPVGVVGVITPWNYPLLLYAESVPGALAVGNAVVLKPAEQTPLTALALAEVMREAGVPDGAFNVVPGLGPDAGRALVAHPGVDMVVFTGSTAVGREIGAAAGGALKRMVLELGGKSPTIVFADADLEAACQAAAFSFTTNQGQLCTAGTRLLVDRAVRDQVVDRIVAIAESLVVGDPFAPGTQLGAIISGEQLARIERAVQAGKANGATLLTGGVRPSISAPCERGTFYTPTVFADVAPSSPLAREEIFGPVLSVLSFDGDDEAVRLANDSSYGLTASVWTSDLERAHRMAAALEVGTVHVNTINDAALAPHDRYKGSGAGLVGGREQLEGMTRCKSVFVNLGGAVPRAEAV